MTHKYKVGDKVLIRKDLECGSQDDTSCYVDGGMLSYRGRVATIVTLGWTSYRYRIDVDDGTYSWAPEFFTPVNELPDTLVINGKHYTADVKTPTFKPFTINIDTLDDAKNLWHRLNAATNNFRSYTGEFYKNFEELQSRHSNIWWNVNSAIEDQDIEMSGYTEESY